jgi:RNA polymerase sigma factor (sigma-70 family)
MEGIQLLDEEIIAGIRNNQLNETIYAIYRQYMGAVIAYVIHSGGNQQDAEDIFQETVIVFIKLVQEGKFRGESAVKTFLVAIARNFWLNEWKKRQSQDRRGKVFEISRGDEGDDILENVYRRETKEQFLEIIDALGEPCKTILVMYYYENEPYKEIVKRLHYENEQVVRNKKYRCMKLLTEMVRNNPILNKLTAK